MQQAAGIRASILRSSSKRQKAWPKGGAGTGLRWPADLRRQAQPRPERLSRHLDGRNPAGACDAGWRRRRARHCKSPFPPRRMMMDHSAAKSLPVSGAVCGAYSRVMTKRWRSITGNLFSKATWAGPARSLQAPGHGAGRIVVGAPAAVGYGLETFAGQRRDQRTTKGCFGPRSSAARLRSAEVPRGQCAADAYGDAEVELLGKRRSWHKGEGSGRMPGSGANSGHCITHPAHIGVP